MAIVSDLTTINTLLSSIRKNLDDIKSSADSAAGSVSSVAKGGGGGGGGTSTKAGNGGNKNGLGDFSNTGGSTGGSGMSGGLGLAKFGLAAAGMALSAGSAMAKAAFAGMPDVSATINRAGQFYNAGMTQGMSRGGLQSAAAATGLTATGMSGQVANYMGGQGVNLLSSAGMAQQRSISNIVQGMNMDPMAAAQAVVGMNSGSTSANLMRNFGIWTNDPTTGKQASMSDTFAQLEQRFNPTGQKYSVSDVNDSFYQGNLGNNLANSGLSQDQQQLFLQFLRNKAQGKGFNPATGQGLGGADNPLSPQYQINKSTEGVQQNYESSYIKGFQTGAVAIENFNNALKLVPDNVKQLNATIATLEGNQGLSGLVTAVGSAIASLLSMAAGSAVSGIAGRAGGGTVKPGYKQRTDGTYKNKSTGATVSKRVATKGGGAGLAKGAGIASAVLGGVALANDAMNGQGWGTKQFSADVGSTVGGIAGSALGTLLDPVLGPLGTIGGGMLGAWLGGMIGGNFGTGGPSSTISNAAPSGSPGNSSIKYTKPVNGPIVDGFGMRPDPMGGKGQEMHHGVDFKASMGTPVAASASGQVVHAAPFGGYGNCVKIKHADGNTTLYGHLSAINVSMGASVAQGQTVGLVGSTGYSTGAHLHFGVMDSSGNFFDPMRILGGAGYVSTGSSNTGTSDSSGAGAAVSTMTADAILSGISAKVAGAKQVPAYGATSSSGMASGGSQPVGNMRSTADSGNTATGNMASMSIPGAGYAKTGDSYVANDGPVNVHAGEAILTAQQADIWRDALKSGKLGSGGSNVTINLSIAQASDLEAIRFANIVKKQLEEDNMISKMGRK